MSKANTSAIACLSKPNQQTQISSWVFRHLTNTGRIFTFPWAVSTKYMHFKHYKLFHQLTANFVLTCGLQGLHRCMTEQTGWHHWDSSQTEMLKHAVEQRDCFSAGSSPLSDFHIKIRFVFNLKYWLMPFQVGYKSPVWKQNKKLRHLITHFSSIDWVLEIPSALQQINMVSVLNTDAQYFLIKPYTALLKHHQKNSPSKYT